MNKMMQITNPNFSNSLTNKAKRRKLMEKKIRIMRFYKRLIFLSFSLTLVLGISIGFFGMKAKAASNEVTYYKYYTSVVVSEGDTLWDYAVKYSLDTNYDKYIKEVCNINNLHNDKINNGMNLILPYYSEEFIS